MATKSGDDEDDDDDDKNDYDDQIGHKIQTNIPVFFLLSVSSSRRISASILIKLIHKANILAPARFSMQIGLPVDDDCLLFSSPLLVVVVVVFSSA